MALHLIRGEKILWQSFPGKNYRTLIFIRDFSINILLCVLFYSMLKDIEMSVFENGGLVKITVILGVVGTLLSLIHQLSFLFTRFFITTDRVIIKKGFISRKMTSVKHEHIHDTKVHQSFTERMMKTGNVFVFTANDNNNDSDDLNPLNKVPCLEKIDNPFYVHKIIEEVLDEDENEHE